MRYYNISLGFTITADGLSDAVSKYLSSSADAILGWTNLGAAITGLKSLPDLRWASPLDLKNAVEKAFSEKFGAKEAAKPKAKVRVSWSPGPSSQVVR